MTYLEFLRVRRVFTWYAGALVALALFIVIGWAFGNTVNFDVQQSTNTTHDSVHFHGLRGIGPFQVPLDVLIALAALGAIGVATAITTSLNRETAYAHFTFVLPIDRARMALQMAAVDVATIVAAGVFFLALEFVTMFLSAGTQAHYTASGDELWLTILGLGTALAWYGMLQAASAWAPTRSGHWSGLTAAAFGTAIPLSQATFLPPLAWLARAVLVIDPLAYFAAVQIGADGASVGSAIAVSLAFRTLAVWLLAAGGMALAIVLWRRVEV